MPQCVKTLKIGSVLLKTGVFKVKKAANSSKAKKFYCLPELVKTFKLFVRYLIGSRLLFFPHYLISRTTDGFYSLVTNLFSATEYIRGYWC